MTDGTRLIVDFVPDRLVPTSDSFAVYLKALEAETWPLAEQLATAVLDDFNNELIPRWIRVSATRHEKSDFYHVVIEDRQPEWNNPALLSRLAAALPAA